MNTLLIYFLIVVCILGIIIYLYKTRELSVDVIVEKKLNGEKYDKHAKDVIKLIDKKEITTADDEYIAGTIYSYHAKNPAMARNRYIKALNKMQTKNGNYSNILYGMESAIQKHPEIRTNELVDIFKSTTSLVNTKKIRENITKSKERKKQFKKNIKLVKPTKSTKPIADMITWPSDWQNVHDSNITNDVSAQISYIVQNNRMMGVEKYTLDDIYAKASDKAKKALDKISLKNEYALKNGKKIEEKNILLEVWARAHCIKNKENEADLEQSILDSLENCIENNTTVCLSGRVTRIIGSLALLDAESEKIGLGILKTKTMVRNEILEDASRIMQKYTGPDSKEDKGVIDKYNTGSDDAEVKLLENKMKEEMLSLENKYKGKLDNYKLTQTIAECISII